MRTLADRRHEQAKADADDRELESRTDRRRQQDAQEARLKALAARLVGLKPSALERLALDDELLAAIATAQAIRSAPARNRQVNVVRQHLRSLGPALQELVRRLDHAGGAGPAASGAAPSTPASEAVRAWIERLADAGDSALEQLVSEHPDLDRQELRQRARELARARAGSAGPALARAEARLRESLEAVLGPASPSAGADRR